MKLFCNVKEPPLLLKTIAPAIDILFELIVAEREVNVIVPVEFQTVPAIVLQFPATVNVGVVPVAKVTVPFVTFKFKQFNAPVIVTVYVAA